jgi:hypothetical protein
MNAALLIVQNTMAAYALFLPVDFQYIFWTNKRKLYLEQLQLQNCTNL